MVQLPDEELAIGLETVMRIASIANNGVFKDIPIWIATGTQDRSIERRSA